MLPQLKRLTKETIQVTNLNFSNFIILGRDAGLYDCPVYKYPRRNDKYLIFRVKLPCEGTGAHRWKLRGVALLCSTE